MSIFLDDDLIPNIRLIIYRKCTPSWSMLENTLEGINLTYLVQGEARYTVDGQTIDLAQGNLLVLPKGSIRRAITFQDRLMHCFSADFVLKNCKNKEQALPLPVISHPGCHDDIIRLFHELSFSWLEKLPGYQIKCNGLFLQILHRFMELLIFKTELYTGDVRITKVIRYIARHYSERLTVKMMAQMVGLNPTYFGVLFNQTLGIGFNQYLTQTRIKNAEIMLASGEYKVGNVAEACGFTDVSHFYKQFKFIKGFPPSYCLPKKF